MSCPVVNGRHPVCDAANALTLNEAMAGLALFGGAQRDLPTGQNSTFRLASEPYFIDQRTQDFFVELGPHLLSFYRAANELYRQSVRGKAPAFIHEYLDQGKPASVIEYGRQNKFHKDLPLIIRPDVIPTADGFAITELDAVPGGFGLLGFMAAQYAAFGYSVVGGATGIAEGFAAALRSLTPEMDDPLVVIALSDESADYKGEMNWLAAAMQPWLRVHTCHPRELLFMEDGLYLPLPSNNGAATNAGRARVDILYRFFELFDLKNIPKMDLILYAVRKSLVAATPPLKAYLEEKMLFALFHHPALTANWQALLSPEAYNALAQVLPRTWVMDSRPLPPHAVIPDLRLGGAPVTDFHQLQNAAQKDRQLVIKPSGFSAEAWGSRGVLIGHDEPAQVWSDGIAAALAAFGQTPRVLQEFYKGKRISMPYYDFAGGGTKIMPGRARLCPYYFTAGDTVNLTGILATVVPLDKKAIHGMVDAIMVPVAVETANCQ